MLRYDATPLESLYHTKGRRRSVRPPPAGEASLKEMLVPLVPLAVGPGDGCRDQLRPTPKAKGCSSVQTMVWRYVPTASMIEH